MATGWERLAVFEGGSVMDLARAQAADGSWHVFAATPVGVFRSVDRGRIWAPLGTGSRVAGAEVVAASPRYAEDGLVYVGAYDGLYQWRPDSPDWHQILTDCGVLGMAIHPGELDVRLDGSDLIVFVGTNADGVLVSRNGGRTWEGANAGLLSLRVYGIGLSPGFSEDGIAFAAADDGLYRTRNGGEAWRQLDTGTEDDSFDGVTLSPAFSEDRLVLAVSYDAGLFRSDDAGRSWVPVGLGEPDIADAHGVTLWTPEGAVAWTESGLALSGDAGQTWEFDSERQAVAGIQLVSGVVCLPGVHGEPETLLASMEGRESARSAIVRSEDGGMNWAPSASGLTAALISNLLFSPTFGQGVFADPDEAVASNGGESTLSALVADQTIYVVSLDSGVQVSRDAGQSWDRISDSLDGVTVRQIAVSHEGGAGRRLFAATDAGLFVGRDRGGPAGSLKWEPAWPDEQDVSTRAIALADAGGLTTVTAALGGGRLAISTDRGVSWDSRETPFGSGSIVALAMSPTWYPYGAIFVATIDHAQASGESEVVVWRLTSKDQRWDQRWERWLEERATGPVQLVALPADPTGFNVVVGLNGRVWRSTPNVHEVRTGSRRPVWATTELLGRPASIAGLTASPDYANDRTLFAATSAGVYVSRDGGASFTPWNDDLEPVHMVAVAISPAYPEDRLVYGLGLGGTIWRREDR